MVQAATQTTMLTSNASKTSPVGKAAPVSGQMGVPMGPAVAGPRAATPAVPNREKALQILSKSIYKELRENGYEPKQIVALATEIISLVTTDIGDAPAA
jgi:hypothetical protein